MLKIKANRLFCNTSVRYVRLYNLRGFDILKIKRSSSITVLIYAKRLI